MPEQVATIRLGLADDHPIFRQGLRALLQTDPGIEVVGEASDGAEAVRMVREKALDVLLLDLAMPRLSGIEVLREIQDAGVKVVIFAAEVSRGDILAALRLGASGVLLKDSLPALVFKCIRCVMNGEHWVGRGVVGDLLKTVADLEKSATGALHGIRLTPREAEVLSLVVGGYTNRDIAEKLKVSTDTVKHHLTNIFDKTGVSNRLELALFAIHHSLV